MEISIHKYEDNILKATKKYLKIREISNQIYNDYGPCGCSSLEGAITMIHFFDSSIQKCDDELKQELGNHILIFAIELLTRLSKQISTYRDNIIQTIDKLSTENTLGSTKFTIAILRDGESAIDEFDERVVSVKDSLYKMEFSYVVLEDAVCPLLDELDRKIFSTDKTVVSNIVKNAYQVFAMSMINGYRGIKIEIPDDNETATGN